MNLKDLTNSELLGLTIYGEGRGEPIESQVAIGSVIRNRVNRWQNSYVDTCLHPKQFSCWNTDDPNYPILTELAGKVLWAAPILDIFILECLYIGIGISLNQIRDNTDGALYYLTSKLFNEDRPEWAKTAKDIKIIGHQTYFSLG